MGDLVGDSPAHDIAAAASAGIRSVWISRGRQWSETAKAPTLIADTAAEAAGHLLAADP